MESFLKYVAMALIVAFLVTMVLIGIVVFTAKASGPVSEGTKVMMMYAPPVRVTVPNLAPDFFPWDSRVAGMEQFPNGNALILLHYENPAGTVMVSALWGKKGDGFYLLAFAVFYEVRPGQPAECYEDLGFVKDGNPTSVLSRVKSPDTLPVFREKLYKGVAIRNIAV